MNGKYPERESTTLELKSELPQSGQIIRTAVGMCNQYGGRIVIGVRDDGSLLGIAEKEADRLLESLHKSIFEASTPPILPNIHLQRLADKLLVVVEIAQGMRKPYFITSEGISNGTYLRVGRSTIRANTQAIELLRWRGHGHLADEFPVYHASTSDLNHASIASFFGKRRNRASGKVSEQLLESYKLINKEQHLFYPTIGGLLLFGNDPQRFISEAFIIATHFNGTKGRDVLATVDLTGTLFEQFEGAMNFLSRRLDRKFSIKGLKRDEQLEIPREALREVILNAVVHRDYSVPAPTKIAIYDDRVEVFSPGIFPGPINVERLDQGITYIRNGVISRAFREAGFIEKLGSGFITLLASYSAAGLLRPTVIEGDSFVKVILPRRQRAGASEPPSYQTDILRLAQSQREVAATDVQRELGVSRATVTRWLKQLVTTGQLMQTGQGRITRYRLP